VFAQRHPLHAVGTRGLPWIEIDFPEDYARAIRDVLPHIPSVDDDAVIEHDAPPVRAAAAAGSR